MRSCPHAGQTDLLLTKAEPISNFASTYVTTYLGKGIKKPGDSSWGKGVRKCGRKSPADTKDSGETGRRHVTGAGAAASGVHGGAGGHALKECAAQGESMQDQSPHRG